MSCLCRVKSACHKWGEIHLVDKCLLVILALLMLQSAFNLFLHESVSNETNAIDIMVRTSAAGIFGYMVSANFNQRRKRGHKARPADGAAPASVPPNGGEGPRAQIGFQTGGGEVGPAVPAPPTLPPDERRAGESGDRAQILVVAAIGTLSLLVLLVFRNLMADGPANAGTISQFRDFVSGSVGFLISSTTSGVESKEGK